MPQQQPPQAPRRVVRYSPLHYNIEDFCARVVPTEEEMKHKLHIVDLVREHTRRAMLEHGRCEVQVFGSLATGLSTWSSDVDLLVTGVMKPDKISGMYDVSDRGRVVGRLRRIADALRRCKKLDNPSISLVPRARIPIIKLKARNVAVDISLSDNTGVRAAKYMAQQVRAFPAMKPLVLVLKAYLRSTALNEVMTGGLSSYSLCNMVIAHLQEEVKAGRDVYDLGEALYSFLLRYGEDFDYGLDAVSVESGGIVPKHALGFGTDLGHGGHKADRLAVDCPITGRDVSHGTFRIEAVRSAFVRAARRLEALARGRRVDDLSVNYLQALFEVAAVLKRTANPDDALGAAPGYVSQFERLMGKGTSPEIIQIGPADFEDDGREFGLDDGDDEEAYLAKLSGDEGGPGRLGSPPELDMWAGLDGGGGGTSAGSGGRRGGGGGKRGGGGRGR